MRKELELFRPSREFTNLQKQMNRFFDEVWDETKLPTGDLMFAPACDISETDTHYVVSVDVPGVRKEDVKIEVVDNRLVISGARNEEKEVKEKNRYLSERYQGSFRREFTLPAGVDAEKIEAAQENGELKVAIPKTEAAKSKTVKIGESKSGLFSKLFSQKEQGKLLKASGN